MDLLPIIVVAVAFVLGFVAGSRVVLIRYVPVEELKASDLYPKGDDDGPSAS